MKKPRPHLLRTSAGLAALSLWALLAACERPEVAGDGIPQVVMISLDTTRADHFGFLGNERVRTPRMDAFAEEAVVFTDAMTAAPTTLASHTTLFTGRYPQRHGVPRNGFLVHPDNLMLPEILHQAGFRTAGFAASFALSNRFDFAQGFDHYDETFDVLSGQRGADQNQRSAAKVNEAVFRYLDETGIPPRLFLFVHYFDPHQPYSAPEPFATAYDRRGRRGLPPLHRLKNQRRPLGEDDELARRHALQYAAEISYLDHHLGRLFDGLRRRDVFDRALVVITSDHGENFWEHPGRFDHGRTLFQTTLRSLCLVRLPGGEWAGARRRPVATVDVLPTVLAELGLEVPEGIDGTLLPLRGEDGGGGPRPLFGQATRPWRGVEDHPQWTNMRKARCIRSGRYKLIQTPFRGTEELYDLEADPGEQHDLLADPSPEVLEVADRLRAELESWAASANPLPSRFEDAEEEDTIQRLRSLGYLQ